MENIPKKITTFQTIMFHLWFFEYTKMQSQEVSIHLGDSFDCVFTQLP